MDETTKKDLLKILVDALGQGLAEQESNHEPEFMKNFLPIPEHKRVLDPDTLLILGGRGAGKTQLFRLLAFPNGRGALADVTGVDKLSFLDRTMWVTGYGGERNHGLKFPSQESGEIFSDTADVLDWRAFWLGLTLGSVLRHIGDFPGSNVFERIPSEIKKTLTDELQLVSVWVPMVKKELEIISFVLDKVDETLIKEDRWLFITYDELDKLTISHSKLAIPIRELLAFWLDRWRRWDRIRPKIFLRNDLFAPEFLGFPDASKLQAYQIRLEWQASWLYQLFMKRMANSDARLLQYLQKVPDVISKHDPILGYIPRSEERVYQDVIRNMVGQFMGKDAKKGITHRWIPNHLQDSNGRIAPRSFIKLFERAARFELERFDLKQLPDDRLLQPTHLQGALMETSIDRIRELAEEEYPWLNDLKPSLAGIEVPTAKSNILAAIRNTEWRKESKVPASDSDGIFKVLLKLGVLETRSDGKVNMPDIYLYGFSMLRRGGIRRPK
ncbi:hypothetical protein EL26_05955 [Tumebacillus flagellatus]|uniref:Uncharacterized protein n=2 Tax=Tumebacillus flagellatus TaxID=1157490 RepID=A0A074LUL7_9BACL|nr:hypothetical protein EL26_05955 [Tumebacillus flagellatus]